MLTVSLLGNTCGSKPHPVESCQDNCDQTGNGEGRFPYNARANRLEPILAQDLQSVGYPKKVALHAEGLLPDMKSASGRPCHGFTSSITV